jgi:hypothetical protein
MVFKEAECESVIWIHLAPEEETGDCTEHSIEHFCLLNMFRISKLLILSVSQE